MRVKLNLQWFLYYGRRYFSMTRKEVLYTKFGEMKDLISCLQIERGELIPSGKSVYKAQARRMTYEEAIALE